MARLTGRTRYQRMLSEETPPLPFNPTWKPAVTVDTADRALLARGGLKSPSPAAEAVLERLFGGESGIRHRRGGDPDVGYGMTGSSSPGSSSPPDMFAGQRVKPYQWRGDPDKGYGMGSGKHRARAGSRLHANLPDPGPKITMAEEEQIRKEVKDVEISLKEIARWFHLAPLWPPWAWRVKGE